MGNSKRAKFPRSPKGKLGRVNSRNVNTTQTLSEQNSLKWGKDNLFFTPLEHAKCKSSMSSGILPIIKSRQNTHSL